MPKVKFLKDLCSGTAGTEHDVQEYESNLLIKLGLATLVSETDPADPVKKGKKSAQKGE